jgi:Cu/Ag efflux pump CusA
VATRQIMVDIDPEALYAKQLSATDVSNAFNLENLIVPAGIAKVGVREYLVRVNSSPRIVDQHNDPPIKTVNGATVYLKDVAQVRDGYAVQTGGELEQIQFLLGHVCVQATERYLGCTQRISSAVNDRSGIERNPDKRTCSSLVQRHCLQ